MRRRLQRRVAGLDHLLGLSAISEMVSSLARTFVLARLLPPDQFGIAVALAVTLSFAELLAEIGLDRSIVRLRPGTDLADQRGTLHALALIRGIVLALILAAASPFLATAFQMPDAAPAFLAIAACPLLRGIAHLGPKEQTRDYQYGPDALATLMLHMCTMAGTIIAALTLKSYWAAPVGLLAGMAAYVAVTQLLAVHPWRLRWQQDTAREAWIYGAPLIPNGLSQGLKSLGDRLVVGAILGPTVLAFYNLTMMVGILPRTIALRYLTTVFLPRFVNSEPGAPARSLAGAFAVLNGGLGLVLGLGLWAVGGPVIALVFGAAYLPPQSLIGATAALVSVRMLYAVVTLPAMAFGGTRYILVGSAGSLIGVGAGALGLWLTRDLSAFVFIMVGIELIALAAAQRIGRKALFLDSGATLASIIAPPALLLGLAAVEAHWGAPIGWGWRCLIAAGLAALVALAAAVLSARAGTSLAQLVATLRAKPPSSVAASIAPN